MHAANALMHPLSYPTSQQYPPSLLVRGAIIGLGQVHTQWGHTRSMFFYKVCAAPHNKSAQANVRDAYALNLRKRLCANGYTR